MRLAAPVLPAWLERLVPFERYAVMADGHRMHVMEQGQGDLTALLVHGNPTWGFLYRKVAARLAGKMRVVMPDLLGLGFSDKVPAAMHQLATHQRVLGSVIDALGAKRVILVVQDWGGPIGLGAMADREDRLAGIVLLNTVVGPPRKGFKKALFHRLARVPLISDVLFRGLGFPQNVLGLAQRDFKSMAGEVGHAYRYPLRRFADNVAPLALARMVPDSFEHPSIPALEHCQRLIERYQGPTAIVWGDKDPILGRVRPWLEKLLPRARVTRTDAGHFSPEEIPGEIADAIMDVAGRAR